MHLYCMNVMVCVYLCVCVCVCVSVCVYAFVCDSVFSYVYVLSKRVMVHMRLYCTASRASYIIHDHAASRRCFVYVKLKHKFMAHPIENTERRNDCALSMNDDTTIAADNVACENRSARPTSINSTQPKKEVHIDISLLAIYEVC